MIRAQQSEGDAFLLTTLFAVLIVTVVAAAGCDSDVDVSTTTPTSTPAFPSASSVQRVVSGKVNDLDGTPLAEVQVSTLSGTPAIITDATGSFSITVESQIFLLHFARDGYEPREWGLQRGDDPVTLNVYMQPVWYFRRRHR